MKNPSGIGQDKVVHNESADRSADSFFLHVSLVERYGVDAKLFLQKPGDFSALGMTPCGLLAVDHGIVCQHFKSTAARRNQRQGFNRERELAQKLARQTEGTWCVVSLYTIFDGQLVLLHLKTPCLNGY